MAQQIHLPIMQSSNITNYVQNAINLAQETSACRSVINELHGVYSICDPIDEMQIFSKCSARNSICEKKMMFYKTGNLDFGGENAERNEVTEEWERLLKRIILTQK